MIPAKKASNLFVGKLSIRQLYSLTPSLEINTIVRREKILLVFGGITGRQSGNAAVLSQSGRETYDLLFIKFQRHIIVVTPEGDFQKFCGHLLDGYLQF